MLSSKDFSVVSQTQTKQKKTTAAKEMKMILLRNRRQHKES